MLDLHLLYPPLLLVETIGELWAFGRFYRLYVAVQGVSAKIFMCSYTKGFGLDPESERLASAYRKYHFATLPLAR